MRFSQPAHRRPNGWLHVLKCRTWNEHGTSFFLDCPSFTFKAESQQWGRYKSRVQAPNASECMRKGREQIEVHWLTHPTGILNHRCCTHPARLPPLFFRPKLAIVSLRRQDTCPRKACMPSRNQKVGLANHDCTSVFVMSTFKLLRLAIQVVPRRQLPSALLLIGRTFSLWNLSMHLLVFWRSTVGASQKTWFKSKMCTACHGRVYPP